MSKLIYGIAALLVLFALAIAPVSATTQYAYGTQTGGQYNIENIGNYNDGSRYSTQTASGMQIGGYDNTQTVNNYNSNGYQVTQTAFATQGGLTGTNTQGAGSYSTQTVYNTNAGSQGMVISQVAAAGQDGSQNQQIVFNTNTGSVSNDYYVQQIGSISSTGGYTLGAVQDTYGSTQIVFNNEYVTVV